MCRALHIFSAVGWIGGIGFLNGVALPIFNYMGANNKGESGAEAWFRVQQRFTGYVWTCAWGLGVSGIILMLLSSNFLWFDFSTGWRAILLMKQIVFLCMVGASLGISRSVKELVGVVATKTTSPVYTTDSKELTDYETIKWRIMMLNKFNMVCGITGILLAAAM